MIPLYVYNQGNPPPKDDNTYIVARNGIFLRKNTGLIRATVKVDEVPLLAEVNPEVELRLPKIPPEAFAQVMLFFRRVYQHLQSEAIILIHYNEKEKKYRMFCPKQSVDESSVGYDMASRFEGFKLVGSIHSHGSSHPYHSGVDTHNEESFDGLHIVIGRVNQPYFQVCSSIVVNNNRFPIDPTQVIVGLEEVDWEYRYEQVNDFRRRHGVIRKAGLRNKPALDPHSLKITLEPNHQSHRKRVNQNFYDIVLPNEADYRNIKVPNDWLARVKHKKTENLTAVVAKGT